MNGFIGLQNTLKEAIPKLLSTAIGKEKCSTAAVNTSAVDSYAQTKTITPKCTSIVCTYS